MTGPTLKLIAWVIFASLIYEIACRENRSSDALAPNPKSKLYYADFILVNNYGKDVIVLTTFRSHEQLKKVGIPDIGQYRRHFKVPTSLEPKQTIILTAFQNRSGVIHPINIDGAVSAELVLSVKPVKTPTYYYIGRRDPSLVIVNRTVIYKYSTVLIPWIVTSYHTRSTRLPGSTVTIYSTVTIPAPPSTTRNIVVTSTIQPPPKVTTEITSSNMVVTSTMKLQPVSTTRTTTIQNTTKVVVITSTIAPTPSSTTSILKTTSENLSLPTSSHSGISTSSSAPKEEPRSSTSQLLTTQSSEIKASTTHVYTEHSRSPTTKRTTTSIPTTKSSKLQAFCSSISESTEWGIFTWPVTKVGYKAMAPCPNNKKVNAVRKCVYNERTHDGHWSTVEARKCPRLKGSSKEIFELSNVTVNASNVDKVVENLQQSLSHPGKQLVTEDIVNSATVLENVAAVENLPIEVGEKAFEAIDNILDADMESMEESQKAQNFSKRLLKSVNGLLNNINMTGKESVEKSLGNLAFGLTSVDPRRFSGLIFSASVNNSSENRIRGVLTENVEEQSTSIMIPGTLFQNHDIPRGALSTVTFIVYKQAKLFNSMSVERGNFSVNGYVMASEVKGYRVRNLKKPIVLTYRQLEDTGREKAKCVFWSFGESRWSEQGCTFQGMDEHRNVICHCNHLTNFAILMDTNAVEKRSSHNTQLSIISYIGCSLSLLGLILTIATILFFRDLRRSIPQQILLNFCIAVSLTLVVFLTAAERSKTNSVLTCRIAAMALHYFSLTVFAWTAVLAFNMYRLFVKVLASYVSKFILRCCFIAWGIPAIVVAITAGLAFENYGNENYCRLTGLPFILAFFMPVVLILVLNGVSFVIILRSLLTTGGKVSSDRKRNGFTELRQGLAILVLLGLTWLFGAFALKDAKLVFQYLFCICNSLQGLLVFLFYCVIPVSVRERYAKAFGCKKSRYEDYSGRAMLRNNDTAITDSYKLTTIPREEKGKTPINLSKWRQNNSEKTRLTNSFGHELST